MQLDRKGETVNKAKTKAQLVESLEERDKKIQFYAATVREDRDKIKILVEEVGTLKSQRDTAETKLSDLRKAIEVFVETNIDGKIGEPGTYWDQRQQGTKQIEDDRTPIEKFLNWLYNATENP